MPSVEFFRATGFFIRPHFLSPDDCARIQAAVISSPSEPGRLVRHGQDDVLDETTRRVAAARVAKSTRVSLQQRISVLLEDLEKHFGVALAGCEPPAFLVYGPGSFFAPHTDTGPDVPPDIEQRVVSVVVFLNGAADVEPDGYTGGALRFYGLVDGLEWARCAFALDSLPGMLVAFPSSIVHEVEPVLSGRRMSIATWFRSAEKSESR